MKKALIIITGIGLIFIVILLYLAHNKRIDVYNYDTAQDYRYNLSSLARQSFNLTIKNGKITLPKFTGNNFTALLKINIKPSLAGRFVAPEINILYNDNNTIISQQFEIGATGIRYLNISKVVNNRVDEITIQTNYARLSTENAELCLFENEKLDAKRILILSPHPDDAEIAAYGLYSTYPQNTYIVTLTAGGAGDFKYDEIFSDSTAHYRAKGKVRTWNSLTVPLLGGVPPEHIVNLGYFNGALQKMNQNKTTPVQTKFTKTTDLSLFRSQNKNNLISGFDPASATWQSLIRDYEQLLDTIKPDIILSPYPKLDSHLDHKYTTVALIEAIKNSNIKKGDLFLYTNHLPQSEAYPFGHQNEPITLPPNFNTNLYFKSIFSFPLSKKTQQEKILALDAMNDLRLDTEYLNTKSTFIHALKVLKRHTVGPEIDYFRRAVRANELFFVIPVTDLYDDEIVITSLAQRSEDVR